MRNQFKAGQKVQCNRCYQKFDSPTDFETGPFLGQPAARQSILTTCPVCGTTDGHWVLLIDVEEAQNGLTGTAYQRKNQLKAWANAH